MGETLTLRPATLEDADLILAWRNDPETRRASHNTVKIQADEHNAWFSTVLKNPDRKLYIAEEQGMAVGSVRADLSQGVWELSWTVSPDARGRGIAKRMVALLANQIADPVRAEVKADNIASIRVAEYAGMKFQQDVDGVRHYRRDSLDG